MKLNISKEAQLGILATVAMCTLYFGFGFLKGSDTFSKNYDYVAIFDNVGSLQSSNAVKLNGVQVGRVKSTQILPERGNKVLVILEVNKKIPLYAGTRVLLTSELLGGSALLLAIPNGGKMLQEGDTIISDKETSLQSLFQEKAALVQSKALPMLEHSDSLIIALNRVIRQFDKTGFILNDLLKATTITAGSVTAIAKENEVSIATISKNLSTLSTNLIETEKKMGPILANVKTTTDSLKAVQMGRAVAELNATVMSLKLILKDVNEGKGSAGKLLKDEALYTNLNRTVVSLNKLMTNFREQPKRYVNFSVFGRKDKGPAESTLDSTSR